MKNNIYQKGIIPALTKQLSKNIREASATRVP